MAGGVTIVAGVSGVPSGRILLAKSSTPVIPSPTGSMANNGAVTLGTALATTYANGWLALPANAIVAGSAAGIYFVQMSSTTVGTVFNNVLGTGIPYVPASPTPFVTTGPGAFTGTAGSVNTILTLPIPAGTLGPNGSLFVQALGSIINNANVKALTVAFGGTNVLQVGSAIGSQNIYGFQRTINNRGVQNAQVSYTSAVVAGSLTEIGPTGGGNALLYSAVDTSLTQNLTIALSSAVATDYCTLESLIVEYETG